VFHWELVAPFAGRHESENEPKLHPTPQGGPHVVRVSALRRASGARRIVAQMAVLRTLFVRASAAALLLQRRALLVPNCHLGRSISRTLSCSFWQLATPTCSPQLAPLSAASAPQTSKRHTQ